MKRRDAKPAFAKRSAIEIQAQQSAGAFARFNPKQNSPTMLSRRGRWRKKRSRGMPRIWLVAAMMLAAGVNEARAWGAAGHSIVAELAERRLKPKALSEMTKLLGGRKSLASISTWADEVQMLRPATRNWHFVNIPFDASDYVVDRDCTQKPGGDCVVRAIERMRAVLADRSKPRLERAEALMFLVHFIGDVHQPMHCVDRNDAGGGQLAVTFFGQSTNLHLVWDVGLIERRIIPVASS